MRIRLHAWAVQKACFTSTYCLFCWLQLLFESIIMSLILSCSSKTVLALDSWGLFGFDTQITAIIAKKAHIDAVNCIIKGARSDCFIDGSNILPPSTSSSGVSFSGLAIAKEMYPNINGPIPVPLEIDALTRHHFRRSARYGNLRRKPQRHESFDAHLQVAGGRARNQ